MSRTWSCCRRVCGGQRPCFITGLTNFQPWKKIQGYTKWLHVPPPCNPHHPNIRTDMRSHAHFTLSLPVQSAHIYIYIYIYVLYNCLLSVSYTTWRTPLSSAETCSCSLCNKLYIYTPDSCVKTVDTLQSSLQKHNGDDEPYDHLLTLSLL